jgi:arginine exporter protein ArgO
MYSQSIHFAQLSRERFTLGSMSKSYIGFLVVAALALLITRIMPDKIWVAAIIVVGALIWGMMKREDER